MKPVFSPGSGWKILFVANMKWKGVWHWSLVSGGNPMGCLIRPTVQVTFVLDVHNYHLVQLTQKEAKNTSKFVLGFPQSRLINAMWWSSDPYQPRYLGRYSDTSRPRVHQKAASHVVQIRKGETFSVVEPEPGM